MQNAIFHMNIIIILTAMFFEISRYLDCKPL